MGESAGFVLRWTPVRFTVGAELGVLSCVYLMPLLWGTKLSWSIPLVYGVSVPVGIGLGALHLILGALAAMTAQLTLSAVAHAGKRQPAAPGKCLWCDGRDKDTWAWRASYFGLLIHPKPWRRPKRQSLSDIESHLSFRADPEA